MKILIIMPLRPRSHESLRWFMKRSMKYKNGFITVPTALFLAAICLFELVLADAASVISAKYFYGRRTSLALESVLAGYDSVLFSKYGLLGLNVSHYSDFETDYIKYISEPFRSDVIALSRLKRRDYELTLKESLAEPSGLKSAITAQMKYRSVANGALYIARALGFLEDAGKLTGAAADVAEGEKIMTEADAKLDELKHKIEGYFSGDTMCVNGYANRKNMYLISAGKILLKRFTSDFIEDSVVLLREAMEEFKANIMIFADLNIDAFDLITELKKDAARIEQCASKAESRLRTISDEETRTNLRKQIAKLRANALVISNDGLVDPLRNNIIALDQRASYISENIRMLDAVYTLSGERIDGNEEEVNISVFLDNMAKALSDTDIRCDLSVSTFYYSSDESLLEYDSRKKDIKDLSIYSSDSYSVPDSIYKMLPSVKAQSSGISFNIFDSFGDLDDIKDSLSGLSGSMGTENALEGALGKLLVCDYVSSYFSDYTDASKSPVENEFVCEKEYIIGGKKDSSDNIMIVSNLLLGIRFAFNFLHCFNDEGKHSFASEIGNAIAGALTYGVGGELFAILIICAWSMAESYLDVRALRNGEKVPVIKNKENWKTSIDGLLSSSPGGNAEETGDSFGLTYSQYLSLLVLLMPERTVLYRIADVIEINMTEYTGERYMLSGIFTSIRSRSKYVPVFISPFFKKYRKERFEIEITRSASY